MSEIVFESTCKDIIMSDLPLTKKQYDESLERTARRNKMSETPVDCNEARYVRTFIAYNELVSEGYNEKDAFIGLIAEIERKWEEDIGC